MTTISPLQIALFIAWSGAVLVAVWKWKYLILRVLPFVIATLGPVVMGWKDLVMGVLIMNIVTGGILASLMLGGRGK